jgi:hypothetical protein
MANQKPFFITGANAAIKVDGINVAYANSVSCQVTVNHVSPRVLGRAEVEAHQPVSYDVSGSLTVIKYGQGIREFIGSDKSPRLSTNKGNGPGSFEAEGSLVSRALGLPKLLGDDPTGAAAEGFDPFHFFQSKQFNIEIQQKAGGNEKIDIATMIRLRDCRFTGLQFQLQKRGAGTMVMAFKARYYDDDTIIARGSGVGQELS